MRNTILQANLPEAPWMDPTFWRLPGTRPLNTDQWLLRDDAFSAQMAERDRLIRDQSGDVLAWLDTARPAAEECLALILSTLSGTGGYQVSEASVTRPDGHVVALRDAHPMSVIGRLIQEDICILEGNGGSEHVLTAAVMCFPASWTLAEKIGRPLTEIHAPVSAYSADIARRVQRMFHAIRPDTPLVRSNALLHERPDLFQPKRVDDGARHISGKARFLRSERQTLRRLPKTGAVVFAIHTFVVSVDRLTSDERAGLDRVVDRHHD